MPTGVETVTVLFARTGSMMPVGAPVAAVLTSVPEALGEMVP